MRNNHHSNMNRKPATTATSVYQRAKHLSPIFPWLFFSSLFSNQFLLLSCSSGIHPCQESIRGNHPGGWSMGVLAVDLMPEINMRPGGLRASIASSSSSSSSFNLSSSSSSPMQISSHADIHQDRSRKLLPGFNYCGIDWADASTKCGKACPSGESTECDFGETCFADCTSCPAVGGGAVDLPVAAVPATPTSALETPSNNNNDAGITGGKVPIPSHCPTDTTDVVNVGYYQSWAKYRTSTCHPLAAADIPVSTFGYTHLVYSFAGISIQGELEPYNGIMDEVSLYSAMNSLKSKPENAGLKTLIAVGGWNFDQTRFTKVSETEEARAAFAQSVVRFLEAHDFDGIDFDWEYPVTRQGSPQDHQNYPLLLQTLRTTLASANMSDKLITVAIPCNPEKLQQGFDLPSLSQSVDWFHLMSYDIHGAWDEAAGSNTDMPYIEMTVDYILSSGVDPSQLTLGFAAYGRSMTLVDSASCATAGCPIDGAGIMGCSGEEGFSPYFELKEAFVDTGNYDSLLLNEITGSMEMVVNGNVWISFDEGESFRIKHDYYLSKCLRGQMWWAIDMIKENPFPNYYGINPQVTTLQQGSPPGQQLQQQQQPKPIDPNNPNNIMAPGVDNNDDYCHGESGLVPVNDCTGFAFCADGRMQGSITNCSPGLIFDANMKICNWPSETNLCGFEFCSDGFTGFVPFDDCHKFYRCQNGKIDGDIDSCAEGTLFDEVTGVCNWASMVECNTKPPTMAPTPPKTSPPTYPRVTIPVSTPGTAANLVESAPMGTLPSSRNPGSNVLVEEIKVDDVDANVASEPSLTTQSMPVDTSVVLRFSPSDDAYVQEENPNVNFNDNFIVVDQNKRFDGLLRFYVQGLNDRAVNYVKLRLFVRNASYFGGNFYQCNTDWHEDVVTWEKVPSVIGNAPIAVVNAVLEGDWIEVDLTGLVKSDGPVALRIISDDPDNVMYDSKDNTSGNAPQLLVGVEPGQMEEQNAAVLNTLKIGPTDDAFVFFTTPNKNYGKHPYLKVDLDNGFKKSFLRFDFSRVNIASIDKAMLRLYATDSSPSGGAFIKTSDTNWNEGTITWNDAPIADGLMLGTFENVEEGNWYELDITEAITESGPLSIAIMGSHEDRVTYSSKDGPHSPEIALSIKEAIPAEGEVKELFPTDDATISLLRENTNFGSESTLEIDAKDGLRNFLLRFDASDIPQGEVTQATLRIYAKNKEPAFGGTFVEVLNNNWKETTVTWDNAPSADGQILGSLMEIEGGSWYDVDVTTAIIGGRPVSFRVSSPHSSVGIYGSKESEHQPRLIVQYTPPEPTPEGAEIFHPTDDASILLENPSGNFGRDGQLKIDGGTGVFNSLLRFDLSSVEKGSVIKAILRLHAVDGSPSGGTLIQTKNTDWSQYTVTWADAPAADGEVITTLGEITPYQWYDIDVTKIAKGGEPISIRIAPSHGNRCAFASKEDPFGRIPQLLVTADLFKGLQ
mmetsp:Transcript_14493/g.29061  ORF Transcript_14493/g.29061 Transcript_14493/m.29061 type:complete len:1465 (-) Transcript_14493:99-4493(-)